MSITCPHCKSTWTYQGDSESTTPADDAWLDQHFDNCKEFGNG